MKQGLTQAEAAGGRRPAPEGQHLAAAQWRAEPGRHVRWPVGVAMGPQGALDGRGGRQGPRLDPRPNARPAEVAVRALVWIGVPYCTPIRGSHSDADGVVDAPPTASMCHGCGTLVRKMWIERSRCRGKVSGR